MLRHGCLGGTRDPKVLGLPEGEGPFGIHPLSSHLHREYSHAGKPQKKPERLRPDIKGTVPANDGDVNAYDIHPYDASIFYPPASVIASDEFKIVDKQRTRGPRKGRYPVVFMNGQLGNPVKHMYQALATAVVSGGTVTGIYNASVCEVAGLDVLMDTLHSAFKDKTTMAAVSEILATPFKLLGFDDAGRAVLKLRFKRLCSPATASLFDWLCGPANHSARIVAHSQGNIIAANALNGLTALRGKDAIASMKVIAVASPVTFWTDAKDRVKEYNFSNDAVSWLSGNWVFPLEKYLQWLPEVVRPHAPDYLSARLKNRGIKEDREVEHSERVVGFDEKGAWFSHSFYMYLAELWDSMIAEFP